MPIYGTPSAILLLHSCPSVAVAREHTTAFFCETLGALLVGDHLCFFKAGYLYERKKKIQQFQNR